MTLRARLILILLAILAASRAFAGQPYAHELRGGASVLSGPERFRFGYYGDNDSWAQVGMPPGTPPDRWFSTASKVSARWSLHPAALDARVLVSASIGQAIYTPRNVSIATIDELQGDRPYSGWLSGSLGVDVLLPQAPLALTAGGSPYTQLGVEVFGGATGPWSYASWVQHNAHHLHLILRGERFPEAIGWGRIETRPALSFDVSAFAETTLVALDLPDVPVLKVVGNRPGMYLLAGGRLDAGGTKVAMAVHSTLIAGLVGDPLARAEVRWPAMLYLFARAEGSLVGWNASIENPLIEGPTVATRMPLVAQYGFGAVARFKWGEVTWSQQWRTNEVSSLPDALKTGQLIGQWSYVLVF